MTQPSSPTKRERRDAARAERQARERAAAAAAIRRRRLSLLGGLVAVAAVIVAVAVAVSSSGGGGGTSTAQGDLRNVAEIEQLLAGVPQKGATLGRADAPVTIVEFADPQCPFCGEFARDELSQVIRDQVRTGKAKLELRMLTFVGPDSKPAARALEAAGLQGKLWNAAEILYHNQGEENSGYIDDAYLRKVLGGVNGLDVDRALRDADSSAVTAALGAAQTLAGRHGVEGTPTVLVGPTGGDLVTDTESAPTAAGIAKLVDAATTRADAPAAR